MMLNPRENGFRPDNPYSIRIAPQIPVLKEKHISLSACPIESRKTSREITIYQAPQFSFKTSSSTGASMSSK